MLNKEVDLLHISENLYSTNEKYNDITAVYTSKFFLKEKDDISQKNSVTNRLY